MTTVASRPARTVKRGATMGVPSNLEDALRVLAECGFGDREGLVVWRTEPDRMLVSDDERGAYTVWFRFYVNDESVHIREGSPEEGWPL